MHLHERLAIAVNEWRAGGYPTESHQTISEILEWASGADEGNARYLRLPQLRALETYWYLRLVRGTPRVLDLYRHFYPSPTELLKAIGLGESRLLEVALDIGADGLLDRVRHDDDFVRTHKLEAVRETLTLDYPSYILARSFPAEQRMRRAKRSPTCGCRRLPACRTWPSSRTKLTTRTVNRSTPS